MTTPDPIETIRAEHDPDDTTLVGQAVHTLLTEVDRLRGERAELRAQLGKALDVLAAGADLRELLAQRVAACTCGATARAGTEAGG